MKVNHEQLAQLILKSYETKLPLFVWGAPGIGKSQTVREVAKSLAKGLKLEYSEDIADINKEDKFLVIDLRLSQLDPSDLRGLPKIDDGETKWLPPNYLPKKGHGILFLDECNLAPPLVQASAYQLVLDRRLGDYKLPEGYLVIAAGNRLEDKAAVFEMASPLANRFLHCELTIPTVEDWSKWASKNNIDGRIIAFLNFRKGYLFKFNPDASDKAFPTPRSWEFCSKLIKGEKENGRVKFYTASAVGEGVAIEFDSFNRLTQKIDIKDYLDKPEKAELPESIDMRYALCYALAEHYSERKNVLRKILIIADKFGPEYGILLLRLCKAADWNHFKREVLKLKEWENLTQKIKKYIE